MWFEAARTGDLDTFHICLFWGQRVDQLSDDGRTALSLAAERGDAEIVRILLERRADPNLHRPGGLRPLTAAVHNEHWDIAASLVRAGADPNADGVASIVIADPPKRQLLALMLKHGLDPYGAHPDWGPYIHFALIDPACADLFFGAGFDLRRYERETGESLLERALSGGVGRMLHLLSLGADVDLPVERTTGRTILMTVAADPANEHADDVIRLLVKRGADLERRDAAGMTALDHARAAGNKAAKVLTKLRAEQSRRAKQQAKARAAADAKAARAQAAADRRAAATPRPAEAKKRKAAPKTSKRRRRRRSPEPSDLDRAAITDHGPTEKGTPEGPPERRPGSATTQATPVESGLARASEEDRNA